MRRISILFALLLLLAASCKKEQKRYSTWYIDGVEHSSNNVTATEGKARSSLVCNDATYRWGIGFERAGGLPLSGEFNICEDPSHCIQIAFYKDTVVYWLSPSNTNTLTASSVDGKASYNLPPTWFIRMDNHEPGNPFPSDSAFTYSTDSVLIKGTFNAP